MIHVNGAPAPGVTPGTTVQALLGVLDVPEGARGVAVAVEREVVPRAEWPVFALDDGVHVEVLNAVQGG